MPDISVRRNHEGAWVVDTLCSEGSDVFLETQSFYYYTKKEAVSLFKQNCKNKGYKIVGWEYENE